MTKTDYVRSEHHEFLEATDEALGNVKLHGILTQLGELLGRKNREAWVALPNSSDARERARAIKDATLAELDKHLEMLEASVQARGGQVYWAENGEEACRQIVEIISARGFTKVVKSK